MHWTPVHAPACQVRVPSSLLRRLASASSCLGRRRSRYLVIARSRRLPSGRLAAMPSNNSLDRAAGVLGSELVSSPLPRRRSRRGVPVDPHGPSRKAWHALNAFAISPRPVAMLQLVALRGDRVIEVRRPPQWRSRSVLTSRQRSTLRTGRERWLPLAGLTQNWP